MALGQKGIMEVSAGQGKIDSAKLKMQDCWNTFQYVSKQMNQWAEGTIMGKDVQDQCIETTEEMEKNIQDIEKLLKLISDLLDRQQQINQRND